jgi:hypothetical protein
MEKVRYTNIGCGYLTVVFGFIVISASLYRRDYPCRW